MNIQKGPYKLAFTAYYHLAKPTVKKIHNEASLKDPYSTIKSCLQSIVYKSPFVIKIRFQSRYTYTFMFKVRTHVQFHSVSQTRAIWKLLFFDGRTDERTLARWAPTVRKKVRPSAGSIEIHRKRTTSNSRYDAFCLGSKLASGLKQE